MTSSLHDFCQKQALSSSSHLPLTSVAGFLPSLDAEFSPDPLLRCHDTSPPLTMLTRHYVFKRTQEVEVEATAFWSPQARAAPYGIGMSETRLSRRSVLTLGQRWDSMVAGSSSAPDISYQRPRSHTLPMRASLSSRPTIVYAPKLHFTMLSRMPLMPSRGVRRSSL